MEENESVDRNEGEVEMEEVKIEITETEEEERKRKKKMKEAGTPKRKKLVRGLMPFMGILAVFISWQAEVVEGVMVLGCEGNMRTGANVGAWTTDLTFNAEGNFSVCVRFQFAQLQRTNIVYKMTGAGTRPIIQLEVNVDNVRVCVKQVYRYHMMDRWLRPRRWYFVCAAYNQDLDQVTTYFNGRVLKTYNLTPTPTKNASELTVAYVTRTPSPNKMTFIGNVTQFNIWSRELTPEEVFDLAYCLDDEDGDIVSWDSAWNLEEAVTYQVNLTDLCKRSWYRDIEVFPASPYKEGVGMCEALGGIVSLPKNLTESSSIVSAARLVRPECILLWIGVTDEEEEGSWTYHLSGRPVHYLPWSIDEPNGFHYENCGGVEAEGVVDDDCAALRCTSCEVAHDLVLTLHGSCETLTHNVNYMMSYKSGKRVFLGYGEYIILYDGTKWIWRDTTTRLVVAELLPIHLHPVGRRWWKLKRPVCNQKAYEIRRLLLSVCRPGHFTCDDGTCIDLDLRCDLKYDCRDNSDESDCLLVRLPPDYKTSVAPRVAGWRYKEGSVGEVRSEVTLTNLRVDTAQMLLKVALNLTLSWLDPRLTYVNLKDDPSLNLVDNNVSDVWRPAVTPLNTVDQPPPSLPRNPIIHIHRQGLPQGDDSSLPEEVSLYLGGDNPLVEQRGIQASFTCDFDLSRYPFDTQPCNLIFRLTPGSPKATRWAGEGSWVKYSGSSLLLEYMVGEVTLSHTHSTLMIHVPLARRNGNAVINSTSHH